MSELIEILINWIGDEAGEDWKFKTYFLHDAHDALTPSVHSRSGWVYLLFLLSPPNVRLSIEPIFLSATHWLKFISLSKNWI